MPDPTDRPAQPLPEPAVKARRVARPGGMPLLWRVPAAWKLLRDPAAKGWEKLLLVAAGLYVVVPLDGDWVPVIGWLDDLGVLAMAAAALHRSLSRYRPQAPAREIEIEPHRP